MYLKQSMVSLPTVHSAVTTHVDYKSGFSVSSSPTSNQQFEYLSAACMTDSPAVFSVVGLRVMQRADKLHRTVIQRTDKLQVMQRADMLKKIIVVRL